MTTKASKTVAKSPARIALQQHRDQMANLGANSRALTQRIAEFRRTVASQQPAILRCASLHAQRRELLGAVAVGEADHAAIDRFDADLNKAEEVAAAARLAVEVAEAGAARLTRDHEAIAMQVAAVMPAGAALKYQVAVEIATGRLAAYRAAAQAFGAAHAHLLGACRAVDSFVDLKATPARLYVTGPTCEPNFVPWLPELPGLKVGEWLIDNMAEVAAGHATAVAELEG